MTRTSRLYAIYKNGVHKGNERAICKEEAIISYIIESSLSDFLDDIKFVSQYSAMPAISGIHHHFIQSVNDN
ncbi:hypothetical protein [Croceibacter atlanticus]|uniref:hypothetical protein n=1 Tax=Croceibacter atlanticus TaxID=313588 RepID=UPI0030D8CF3C|tara:strand:+ start:62368 stop:62583 length:216 start_codon:yes stop_codon:yes gene_type:complete